MNKTGKREDVACTAALMVEPQGVSARKCGKSALINPKRKRCAHAGNRQSIEAGSFECGEIGFEHCLIGWRRVGKSSVGPGPQLALKNFLSCDDIEKGKAI